MTEVKQAVRLGIEGVYDGDICPECGKVHVPNAETLAAMQETEDQIAGRIPEKRYYSIEEFFTDLYN